MCEMDLAVIRLSGALWRLGSKEAERRYYGRVQNDWTREQVARLPKGGHIKQSYGKEV